MENEFETLISSFIDNKVGLHYNFLKLDLSKQLQEHLLQLFEDNRLKLAGVGNDTKFQNDKSVRNDIIYWLDRKHENIHENAFLDVIDEFVKYLNRTCYSGITGYEFHYAMYEKGSFYKRHLDQFKDNGHRAFSMIIYLNPEWLDNDGGELCIYHSDHSQIVNPTNGKCVFFKSSELEHEVLLNNKNRMSITGWLKTN